MVLRQLLLFPSLSPPHRRWGEAARYAVIVIQTSFPGGRAEIGLTERQRQDLIAELQKTQSDMVPLQFEVSQASEDLASVVSAGRIREESALAESLMELETRVRSRHLTLLIRVKNLLTPEQQKRLRRLRSGGES